MQLVNTNTGEVRTVPAADLKRAKRTGVRAKIVTEAQAHKLNCFLTLTLQPDKIAFGVCPLCFIRLVWDRFLKRLNRASDRKNSFISVIETTKNGTVHLHALINSDVRLSWIRQAWTDCGGGFIVSQRFISVHSDIGRVAAYITKDYIEAKQPGRLVTCSRDIDLEPVKGNSSWELLPPEQPIDTELSWENADGEFEAPEAAMCAHGYFIDYLLTYVKDFFRSERNAISATVHDVPPPALDSFIITDPRGQT